MKKRTFLFICLLCVLTAPTVAEAVEERAVDVEVGTEISSITYKEPGVMRDEGVMYGITGSLTHRHPLADSDNKLMARVEGKYSYGHVDYEAAVSGTLDYIEDHMWEFRGLLGCTMQKSERTTITPYIGIGSRYLNDDSSNMQASSGAYGYERESRYIYIPMGIETETQFEKGWGVNITLEYDYFLMGRQMSHISDVDLGYNDIKNDQDNGYGFRGSFLVTKESEKVDFLFGPFIKYWYVEHSDYQPLTYNSVLEGYGVEPKNNSTECGVRCAVQF